MSLCFAVVSLTTLELLCAFVSWYHPWFSRAILFETPLLLKIDGNVLTDTNR